MYNVLIIDDEYLMREALKRMIEMVKGFRVCATAENGAMALLASQRWKPDIIFMDVIMPGMNGIEAAKAIRAQNKHTAIYLISAYNEFDYAKEAIKINVAEYLVKPLSVTTVKRVLEEFRGLNQQRDSTFKAICECIESRRFFDTYYRMPKIVANIIEESWNDSEETISYYYQIEEQLIQRYNCTGVTSYVNKPAGRKPPMAKWLTFRLFATLDVVFRCNAISDYPVMARAFDYIDDHVYQNIGLYEVQTNCNLSQGYLSRIFKKTLGISVMEYIHLCRMVQAKWLFCTEKLSVADVAYRLGYNESSYFSKIFKKYEHLTISDYKKEVDREREATDEKKPEYR